MMMNVVQVLMLMPMLMLMHGARGRQAGKRSATMPYTIHITVDHTQSTEAPAKHGTESALPERACASVHMSQLDLLFPVTRVRWMKHTKCTHLDWTPYQPASRDLNIAALAYGDTQHRF